MDFVDELKEALGSNSSGMTEQGVLFVDGEFDESLANKFRSDFLTALLYGNMEITIFINSYGGGVYEFLTIYGLLKSAKGVHINTVINGYAMSAGAYLAMLGNERYATRGSRIMLHELSTGVIGTLTDAKIDLQESNELHKELKKIVRKVVSKDVISDLDEWLSRDRYMNVKEAYDIGLLTHKNYDLKLKKVEYEDDEE